MSRAADMACRLLLRHGDGSLPVDPAAMLKRCRNTEVLSELRAAERTGLEQVLPADADALTFRTELPDGSTAWRVVFRRGGDPARLRFTLAHELGHIALDHTGSSPEEEREADCFASHLLCPRPVLRALAACQPLYAEQVMTLCFLSRQAVLRTELDSYPDADPALERQVGALFLPSLPELLPETRLTPLWHRLRVPGTKDCADSPLY